MGHVEVTCVLPNKDDDGMSSCPSNGDSWVDSDLAAAGLKAIKDIDSVEVSCSHHVNSIEHDCAKEPTLSSPGMADILSMVPVDVAHSVSSEDLGT